jgi:hypothetical protein
MRMVMIAGANVVKRASGSPRVYARAPIGPVSRPSERREEDEDEAGPKYRVRNEG